MEESEPERKVGAKLGVFAVGNRVKAGESGHDLCVSAAGSH